MPSYKLQEVCTIYAHTPRHLRYILKDGIIHWLDELTYRRYNIESNVYLDPVMIVRTGDLLSVSEQEIAILREDGPGDWYDVHYISLRSGQIVRTTMDKSGEGPERQVIPMVSDHTCDIVWSTSNGLPCLEVIPFLKDKSPCKIMIPEGYKFIDISWVEDHLVSLWSKDNTYHLLDQEGIKDTGVSVDQWDVNCTHIPFRNGLLTTATSGLYIGGKLINKIELTFRSILDQDHILCWRTGKVYRIRDLEEIKVKSCTKRT